MNKKAQIQLLETVGALVIVFILIALGLTLFTQDKTDNIRESVSTYRENEAITLSMKVATMPEFTCSLNNIQDEACFDLLKIKSFTKLKSSFKGTDQAYYSNIFGNSLLVIETIYPCESLGGNCETLTFDDIENINSKYFTQDGKMCESNNDDSCECESNDVDEQFSNPDGCYYVGDNNAELDGFGPTHSYYNPTDNCGNDYNIADSNSPHYYSNCKQDVYVLHAQGINEVSVTPIIIPIKLKDPSVEASTKAGALFIYNFG